MKITGISGARIKLLGYKPDSWWKYAIQESEDKHYTDEKARAFLDQYVTETVTFKEIAGPVFMNIDVGETQEEKANITSVMLHAAEIARLPTVTGVAIMPDACPVGGPSGTIPVGGVVASKAIHPGMHSSDVCCSVAISLFPRDTDPTLILDAGMKLSHFGAGGRNYSHDTRPSSELLEKMEKNKFLTMLSEAATKHFATQGDGNHFFYVGRLRSTEQIALVTHHGSRKPGAELYKRGLSAADKWRKKLAPDIPVHNAWIPADTEEAYVYWDALQLIRQWTKSSHFAIHDLIAKYLSLKVKGRFWNEHNFVFTRGDEVYYHAKGATPAWEFFAADSCGLTLIPLNMAEPILVVRGRDNPNALGFSPHGAGRNLSRTAMKKLNAHLTPQEMIASQAHNIDVRYFNGEPDISELPNAYKDAASVIAQIKKYDLATIEDYVDPIGNIMAGEMPWKR